MAHPVYRSKLDIATQFEQRSQFPRLYNETGFVLASGDEVNVPAAMLHTGTWTRSADFSHDDPDAAVLLALTQMPCLPRAPAGSTAEQPAVNANAVAVQTAAAQMRNAKTAPKTRQRGTQGGSRQHYNVRNVALEYITRYDLGKALRRVAVTKAGGCWLAQGMTNKGTNFDGEDQGYVTMNFGADERMGTQQNGAAKFRRLTVHAAAFFYAHPEVLVRGSFDVGHLCHNSRCINPAHLNYETAARNQARKGCHGVVVGSQSGACIDTCEHQHVQAVVDKAWQFADDADEAADDDE